MPKRIIQKTSITPQQKLEDLCGYTDELGDCLIWKGALNSDGYPHMFGNVKVHRLVYQLATGEDISGKLVCHKCDIPTCINPEHLISGTEATNGHDKFLRNRQPRVITKEIVFKVRELLGTISNKQIAAQLGINHRRVSDVKVGLYNDAGKFVRNKGE